MTGWLVPLLGPLLLAAGGAVALAGPPVLERFFPAGVGLASTNHLVAQGKLDSWPVEAWVEGTGLRMVAETNRGAFRVEVEATAVPGPRWVRLYTAEGASEPRFVVISDRPEAGETEPNHALDAPQAVEALPVSINGRLDRNGDVDGFAVRVPAGRWLQARLDAYTLMSEVDAVLRLMTVDGRLLAWNHDDVTLDPGLTWLAPGDQTVIVQVFGFRYPADAAVRLTGGDGAVYRLHLDALDDRPDRFASGLGGRTPGETGGAGSGVEEEVEQVGVLGLAGEVDRYPFRAEAGARYEVAVNAASWGSPLDAWLALEDGDGKELARVDDVEGSPDPRLDWQAPVSGAYRVVVGSTLRVGSEANRYQVTARRAAPEFGATVAAGAWVLRAGATNEVTVSVTRRHGHRDELRVACLGLPEGVVGGEATLAAGDGGGDVVVRLSAAEGRTGWSGPVRLRLVDPRTGAECDVVQELTSRGVNNGVPQGYSRLLRGESAEHWLTVLPVADPAAVTNAPTAGGE